MKISKDLDWLKPYLVIASGKVNITRLKRISAKKPKKNFIENQACHGIITKYFNGKDHRITLYTDYIAIGKIHPEVELSISPYSKIDTLCFFAHELAHLAHWDHTTDHKSLEATLIKLFMTKLKKDGYISEEDEASYNEPCRREK